MILEFLFGIFMQTISFFQPPPPTLNLLPPSSIPPSVIKSSPSPVSPAPSSKPPRPKPAVKSAQTSTIINTNSVLKALNNYRFKNGVGALLIDNKLQSYAQSRADYLKSIGKLDNHTGHKQFMASDGFNKLGFNAIAENHGWNYKGGAKDLIESFYAKSSGHNKNQLNPEYSHVGIGIADPYTDLIFGGKKQ